MKKILAFITAAFMVFSIMTVPVSAVTEQDGRTPADTTLNVGCSYLTGSFNPFFVGSADDLAVSDMTQVKLLTADRCGLPVTRGIRGESVPYGGSVYTYYGPADLVITANSDGTVFYDFTLRQDIAFSDGVPMTIDDVIFSMYVLCDPSYDGQYSFAGLPILGLGDYVNSMGNLFELLCAFGRDNTDFSYWSAATQTAFWASVDETLPIFAETLINEIIEAYGEAYGVETVEDAASIWGYYGCETVEDFAAALYENWGDDIVGMSSNESIYTTFFDCMADYADYNITIQLGEPVPNIAGIRKTGEYSLRVILTEADPSNVYSFAIDIAPMHYYGETAKYDYDNDMFGFDKGDLSHILSRTEAPMGAGPYRFTGFDGEAVSFEANEGYYLGCPKTGHVNFITIGQNGAAEIVNGAVDIAAVSLNDAVINTLLEANGGTFSGPVVDARKYDNLGYGYIGLNAINVSVGGDPSSEASKDLRKAFATILSVFREADIAAYYGAERANIIDYPISNTSWTAQHPGESGYETAFSRDVNGDPIYTAGMTDAERQAAALEAALGFFRAAGYTVQNGRLTAAPSGARLSYSILIPGGGEGDHPCFGIASDASAALGSIGMELEVRDLWNSSDLWNSLDELEADMWAAAYVVATDPSGLEQLFYSDAAHAPSSGTQVNPNGGPGQGSNNYQFCLADAELDAKLTEARSTFNTAQRKALYRQSIDIINDWSVMLPVYQRQNAVLFSAERVNPGSIPADITPYYGWLNEVHKLVIGGSTEPGDMNGDTVVDVGDALLMLRAGMGLIGATPEQIALCDVDGDGAITIADALLVMRAAMGLITLD